MPSTPSHDDIKNRKVELVLQQLDALPTLPAVVVRLLALTNSTESRISEVVQLLSADQSLTGKLLSLAGSAASGVQVPVTSVQQAVVLLGFETVRNLALSVKVFEAFQPPHGQADDGAPESLFKREEFWKHSLAVATAAEMLAAKVKPKLNPADAFVCGLLHDIGKVAFDTVMPKSFARVVEMAALTRGDIAEFERRIIGFDHTLAGKHLAEAWNLPQLITQVIWFHGNTPPPPPPAGAPAAVRGAGGPLVMPMVLLIGLADRLVRGQHIGFSGNYPLQYDVEQYTVHLGLSAKQVEEVTEHLAGELEKRARGIGLYDIESRQVYLESIANANAELGRLNHQYRVQNKQLTNRSQCFELLTKFYQRIVPAASPAQLLTEIGQVAHGFLESHRLVLFSQDPSQTAAGDGAAGGASAGGIGEVLLFDAARPTHDSFLMDMPAYGGDQRVGRANQNFTRPAMPQVEWLLERVRGFLGMGAGAGGSAGQPWFMPLLCGNEPVGGIIWMTRDGSVNSVAGIPDMELVSQSWGMTLRTAQLREQQMALTESLAAANRELGAMQQQRVREKSLASLGEMAAGAAHEMNNPLMVISGRAQLLAAKIADAGMKGEASLIAQQADRLSQIITDMMEFAKPVSPKMGALAMPAVVEDAAKAASEHAGAGPEVKVRVETMPSLPAARGDARQIRGALTEIILNAIQASRLEAAARKRESADDVLVSIKVDPLDQQMVVQVADRGAGMSQDVLRNAFAPFFSAKSAGRNRGMGLAKALRWVENHGGTIRLDSTLGKGTTAVVILPLQAGEEIPAPAQPALTPSL